MEILFKGSKRFFYISGNNMLFYGASYNFSNMDLYHIKHLDDVEILYHYKRIDGREYPVYYEHNGRFITKYGKYYTWEKIYPEYIKDYTVANLKILESGDII